MSALCAGRERAAIRRSRARGRCPRWPRSGPPRSSASSRSPVRAPSTPIDAQAHRLVHVLIVGAVGAVGADAEVDAELEHAPGMRDAAAQPHVAAGIVRHGRAMVGEPAHVVVVEPDAVRHGEVRPEQAQLVEMRRSGCCPSGGSPRRPASSIRATWLCSPTPYSRARSRQPVRNSSEQCIGMVGATARRTCSRSCAPAVQRLAHVGERRSQGATRSDSTSFCSARRQRVHQAGNGARRRCGRRPSAPRRRACRRRYRPRPTASRPSIEGVGNSKDRS